MNPMRIRSLAAAARANRRRVTLLAELLVVMATPR
jgi:hypothetical protein